MDQLRRSLDELIPLAEAKGIILGFENREDLEELPMDDEMPALLDHYADCPHVGYWYDPGHSQEKSDLGVISPEDNLKAAGKHLAGVHFQDYTEEGKPTGRLAKALWILIPFFSTLSPRLSVSLN